MAGVVSIVFHPSVWHRRIPRLALDHQVGELITGGGTLQKKPPGPLNPRGSQTMTLQAVVVYVLRGTAASSFITRSANSFDGLNTTFGLGGMAISTSGFSGFRPVR